MDKYTLKTAFRKSFSGIVWRIEADLTAGILAVETRDEDTGHPSFSAMEYATGTFRFHEKQYGDRNWSLAGVVDGLLILRAWGQNTPEGAGITSINATTGAILWEQFNYTLVAIENQQLVVRHRNFASGYEQYLRPHDGNLVSQNSTRDTSVTPNIGLPARHVGTVPRLLDGYDVKGDLFSYHRGDQTVWAFHEANDHTYRVRLVVSHDSDIQADTIVVANLSKMAPELFFAIDNHLFFIGDNKREIVAYLV